MEFEVAVSPIEAPLVAALVVAQSRDRETGVFALVIPGRADFDDGDDVVIDDGVFVFDLIPDFFRGE